MPRKVIKVYLTTEQKRIPERLCKSQRIDESEALPLVFMDYAKSVRLVAEKVGGKI
jgi:hypothetical protein